MLKYTLGDDQIIEANEAKSPADIIAEHKIKSADQIVAAQFNGALIDWHQPMTESGSLAWIKAFETIGFVSVMNPFCDFMTSDILLLERCLISLFMTALAIVGTGVINPIYLPSTDTIFFLIDLAGNEPPLSKL